ncbi:transposable element Tcb2 transposase [Trichonephila clavipes]|uniref:Transposable element Tcb2 transposase n=1 Tax=Trichonephila clavipes TaxID=2585209 RepID=A0A8X6V346_TRICX|nr:transposable element Tcb2 transposase [Trichonephila clavipes]
MWNVSDWQNVVFSDESRFVLGTDDNRVRERRHPGAIFQQDNALPYASRVAQDFLRHFQTLPWPSSSPDLSPVEHVWDQLKRQMPSCHSVHDLELAVQDLWVHLPQDNIRKSIGTMSYDYVVCRKSLEFLFGLGVLGNIKIQNTAIARVRASKLPAAIGIRVYDAGLKRDTSSRECTRSAMVKLESAAPLEI